MGTNNHELLNDKGLSITDLDRLESYAGNNQRRELPRELPRLPIFVCMYKLGPDVLNVVKVEPGEEYASLTGVKPVYAMRIGNTSEFFPGDYPGFHEEGMLLVPNGVLTPERTDFSYDDFVVRKEQVERDGLTIAQVYNGDTNISGSNNVAGYLGVNGDDVSVDGLNEGLVAEVTTVFEKIFDNSLKRCLFTKDSGVQDRYDPNEIQTMLYTKRLSLDEGL